jgi:hypothetical protein
MAHKPGPELQREERQRESWTKMWPDRADAAIRSELQGHGAPSSNGATLASPSTMCSRLADRVAPANVRDAAVDDPEQDT